MNAAKPAMRTMDGSCWRRRWRWWWYRGKVIAELRYLSSRRPALHAGAPDLGRRADLSLGNGLRQLLVVELALRLSVGGDVPDGCLRSRWGHHSSSGTTARLDHSIRHSETHTQPHAFGRTATGRIVGRCEHGLAHLILLEAIHVADDPHAGARVERFLDIFR